MTQEPRTRAKGLGRGLNALFGEDAPALAAAAAAPLSVQRLPVAFLEPGKFQPRRAFDEEALAALAESIKERGVLQPILVRRITGPLERYEIVAGERRWRAAQRVGLHEVPVVVRDLDDKATLEFALIENVQRQDLSPLEEAEGYSRLMEDFAHTQEGLAKVVGKSRSHIANTLRLLALPDPVKSLVQAGDLTAGHARALLTVGDPVALAREVVRRGLSVRQTEDLVRNRAKAKKKPAERNASDPNIMALTRDLANHLGVAVTLAPNPDGSGTLILRYRSLEDFDRLMQRLIGKSS